MGEDIGALLSRLPADRRIDRATCEFLDQEIRRGTELNRLQRESVLAIVQWCVEQALVPPTLLESFCAYVYIEWTEEAKRSEEVKPRLADLVRLLKANPEVANRVAQMAQRLVQERQARRAERARETVASRTAAEGRPGAAQPAGVGREPPNVYVAKMQAARHGVGETAMHNLDLAVQHAEEAVEAYPHHPKVLFEAAGCHQLLAEKGTHHSLTTRYVHMREAVSLYEQCLACLSAQPYAQLGGEYDKWRRGLADLLVKIRHELAALEEQQG